MRSIIFLFAVIFLLSLQACATNGKMPASDQVTSKIHSISETPLSSQILKVKVDKTGQIFIDGRPVPLEELKSKLASLPRANSMVWYYREKADEEPPPVAKAIFEAIFLAQLPIRLSSKLDYSDAIGPNGIPVAEDCDIVLYHPDSYKEGSSTPRDLFEPHMPTVGILSDMDALFATARGGPLNMKAGSFGGKGQVAIVMPEREILYIPGLHMPIIVDVMGKMLPKGGPWNISVISYTKREAFEQDKTMTKSIPFLGYLLAWADLGHNIVVFEGHSSALEAGVRKADVVIIDSGMLPFLQNDWPDVVFRAISPNGKVFMHKREDYQLWPVIKKTKPPGWQYGEPNDEQSYVRILLTTIANAPRGTVRIVSGRPVPRLWPMSNNPDELEYFEALPFEYDQLNSDKVIDIIVDHANSGLFSIFKAPKKVEAKVVGNDGNTRDVVFKLSLTKGSDGSRQLEIDLE